MQKGTVKVPFYSGGRTRYSIRGTYLQPPGYTMSYRQVRCKFQSCGSYRWRKKLC